jgi:PAT family beta-lactamase induction signal transducer AmpG
MLLALAALLVAACSASQDVVSDGYRTTALTPAQLGPGASRFISGYRLALIVAGAGALALADWLSWPVVFLIMAGIAALGLGATALAPEPPASAPPRDLRSAIIDPARDLYQRHGPALATLALFTILFKLPETIAGNWTTPLLKNLKFSNHDIALAQQLFGLALTIPGALLGGVLTKHLGLRKSLWVFGIAGAVSNLGFTLLAIEGRRYGLMYAALGIESFCGGLVAAGFMAFLMAQCHRAYATTQYAILTGLMALSGSLLGMPMGYLVDAWGYPRFFVFSILMGVPGLALLAWMSVHPRGPEGLSAQVPTD